MLSSHKQETSHEFEWDNFKILYREINTKKREYVELLYIKKDFQKVLNKKSDLASFDPPQEIVLNQII